MKLGELAIGVYFLMFISYAKGQYYNNYYNSNNYNPYPYQQDSSSPGREDGSLQCARLWDAAYYQGRSVAFRPNERRSDLGGFYFRPQAVKVKSGCSLTIIDYYGRNQVLQSDSQWMGGSWNQQLSASCCECDGCEAESVMKDLQCARLYEHEKCNGCTGFRLDLKNGDTAKWLGPLDNRMSSLALRPGCQLVVYYERDFMGWRYNFTRSANILGNNWHKQISSVQCFCPYDPNPVTPYPTYSPTTTTTTTTPPPSTTMDYYYWEEETTTIKTKPTPTTTIKTTTTTPPPTTTMDDSWEEEEETTTIKPTTTTTIITTTTTTYEESPEDWDSSSEIITVPPTDYSEPGGGEWGEDKKSSEDDDDEDEDDGFFDSDEDDEDTEPVTKATTATTTTPKPVTTTTVKVTTTQVTTTTEEVEEEDATEEDDDWSWN